MSVFVAVFGGDGLRRVVRPPSTKKWGVGRFHVLRSTKFYRQICSGFQGRLGFPGTDNLVQRPVARRRLWRILREHGAAESAEACPARHLWSLQSRGWNRVCVEAVVVSTASTPGCGARGLLPFASIVADGRVRPAAPSTREGAHILKGRLNSTGAT